MHDHTLPPTPLPVIVFGCLSSLLVPYQFYLAAMVEHLDPVLHKCVQCWGLELGTDKVTCMAKAANVHETWVHDSISVHCFAI